ncbi:MAG: DUF2892 domain-containing protein [Gammaproteobacteria bacterium]|nr:DUF2892 domain-containing protein [Gammaproteobacteria bacterium]
MNTLLSRNMTDYEVIGRLFTGAALISGVMFFSDTVPPWVALVAVYPVMTAITAWDPLYATLIKMRSFIVPAHHGHRKLPLAS